MEDRIGKLVKIFYEPFNKGTKARWFCKCDCGNSLYVYDRTVKKGNIVSCGCVKPLRKKHKSKHGMHLSKTYKAWQNMKTRCDNPETPYYINYGGRGISYDPYWSDFENFYNDMGEVPDGLTLDRVDVNGSYCKDNCRWADWKTQATNKRASK